MGRKPEVTLTFAADSKNLEKAFDRAGQSAKDMAGDFDKAAAQAKTMGSKVDAAGSAVGNQESKFMGTADVLDGLSTALGLNIDRQIELARAAGDITGGIENLKETVSTSVDKFGDMAKAVKANGVEYAKNTAAAVKNGIATGANTVKTIAQTVATNAQTVAQKALNLAMRANPILLVVTALAALTAAFVVAYKNSETFRDIVHGALDAVKGAAETLGTAFTTVIDGIQTAFNGLGTFLDNYGLYLLGPVGAIIKHWDSIKGGASTAVEGIKTAFDTVVTFLGKIPGRIADVVTSPFKALSGPAEGAKKIITTAFDDVVTFIGNLPGRIAKVFVGVAETLVKPFRNFYNAIPGPVRALLEGRNPFSGTGGDTVGDVIGKGNPGNLAGVQASTHHTGGIVPGPRGVPTNILALGGERVLPPGQSGGASVNITINALDPRSAYTYVRQALEESVRINGPIRGVAA